MRVLLFVLIFSAPLLVRAYSDFIGLGYSNCMVCHYNAAGGGALSDYGRALFASEIAAKPFWNSKASDDELADASGFLGAKELPWWFHPGFKYRGLYFQTDPGSANSVSKFVNMQADANVALQFDQAAKKLLVLSIGYAPTPQGNDGSPEQTRHWTSHEYYFRWEFIEKNWLYVGFLDRVFGIRTPDHTAYSRQAASIGQYDQAHSIVYQKSAANYDFFFQPFFGNLEQKKELRAAGVTTMYEYQLAERVRVGVSYLMSKNDYVERESASTHVRIGVPKGHSFQTELGLTRASSAAGFKPTPGFFGLFQASLRWTRGLQILSIGEYYKQEMKSTSSDQVKWRLGAQYFPAQRYEIRTEFVNSRSVAPDSVAPGGWSFETQLHLSL